MADVIGVIFFALVSCSILVFIAWWVLSAFYYVTKDVVRKIREKSNVFCTDCGERLTSKEVICHKCGNKLSAHLDGKATEE